MVRRSRKNNALPGFGLSLGFTLFYLCLIVLFPLAGIVLTTFGLSWETFWSIVTDARVVASYRLSFSTAFYAAFINATFGLLTAWVLVRYSFPGRKIVDALIDLPFALPTAVAGISLTAIYAPNGIIGKWLATIGIQGAYSPLGITLALIFIGLPFVVRTVQPVLAQLDTDVEEASAMLGARRWTTFRRVIFPQLLPALLTGFALAFARGIGEYGSVVFISGNMPFKTEIAPLLIRTKLEQYDVEGATAIAFVMLLLAFILLIVINVLQWLSERRTMSV